MAARAQRAVEGPVRGEAMRSVQPVWQHAIGA